MVRGATAVAASVWIMMVGWFVFDTLCLPDSFTAADGESFQLVDGLFTVRAPESEISSVTRLSSGSSYNASVYLFDSIPLKTVRVSVRQREKLVPGGSAFGAKMFTEGVLVVGLSDVDTEKGRYNPAERAGLKLGDIILTVAGERMQSNEQLADIVEKSGGEPLLVIYLRENVRCAAVVTPAKDRQGNFRLGMWVRDSTAGIGTLTYYDPDTGVVAGLGHGITDADTGMVMPVADGELCYAEITGVNKAVVGTAGELIGVFSGREFADMTANCDRGVYGRLTAAPPEGETLEIAYKQEIKKGAATILCSADGELGSYDIVIESVDLQPGSPTKNMLIRITDRELLQLTGGIVQGMSGSPIIQDGKLIGAVTHVLVNDPTRGYGIFIENMLEAAS